MEPQVIETPVQSRGGGPTAPPRPPERKRRFQIVKLEERIAPGQLDNPGYSHACFSDHGRRSCACC
jgi:hypothetical protein